nr:crinkler 31 [Plasmopara viticola]
MERTSLTCRNMVRLFCAVVWEKGGAFSVTIDTSEFVGDLKNAIKKKMENELKDVDADKLQLFLTKKGDKTWLESSADDVKKLKKGKTTTLIEALIHADNELDGEFGLDEALEGMPEPKFKQIHVLVVVPKGATDKHDLLLRSRDFQRRLMQYVEAGISLRHKQPKSYSNATLGQLEMQRLKKDNLIINAAPTEDGEAFWSKEIQDQADAISNEAVFDAFITSFFDTSLQSYGLVFVNSERYQWLSQSTNWTEHTNLSLNGFATHRGMFRGKPVPDNGVVRPSGFRFGVAEEELFDCLILFKSKLTITEAAFRQVVRYLQTLLPEASATAILFDRRSFWLIKSHRSVVVKVQMSRWTDSGSKALSQNFIADNVSPWVSRLTLTCMCLGVDVVEGDAFLGRGAFGRVFKVIRQDGQVFALKFVEKSFMGLLFHEKEALMRAQHTGLTARLASELIDLPESAALLLSPVGKPLPHPRTREEVQSLFGLLWQLHTNDLVHGDARVPNVILHGEKLLWIDLVEVMEATPHLKGLDAELLTRSILDIPRTFELNPALVRLIKKYGERATSKNLNRLAQAVCRNFGANFS